MNDLLAELVKAYRKEKSPEIPSTEVMAKTPWEEMYQHRLAHPNDPQAQAQIAPYEHRAWAREAGDKGVINALVTGLLMSPAYQGTKALGIDDLFFERNALSTPASLEQVKQSAIGGLEGARDAFMKYLPERLK